MRAEAEIASSVTEATAANINAADARAGECENEDKGKSEKNKDCAPMQPGQQQRCSANNLEPWEIEGEWHGRDPGEKMKVRDVGGEPERSYSLGCSGINEECADKYS